MWQTYLSRCRSPDWCTFVCILIQRPLSSRRRSDNTGGAGSSREATAPARPTLRPEGLVKIVAGFNEAVINNLKGTPTKQRLLFVCNQGRPMKTPSPSPACTLSLSLIFMEYGSVSLVNQLQRTQERMKILKPESKPEFPPKPCRWQQGKTGVGP